MGNKTIIKRVLSVTAAIMLTSCSKELSMLPKNAVVGVDAITGESTAQIVLNGAYFRFANGNASNYTDWTYHELPGSVFAGYLGNGFGIADSQESNNYTTSSPFVQPIWNNNYQLVEASNDLISGISKLSAGAFTGSRRNEMLGEARFLRAYADFRILSFFGQWWDISSKFGIVIRDQPSAVSNIARPRSNVSASYDFIISDLDFAIANAPATNPDYYATRWAAMALKMRVLISRGAAGDYVQVIALAEAIKQSGIYTLENNLKDIFYVKGLGSSEVILGVQPYTGQEKALTNLSRTYYPGNINYYVTKKSLKDLLGGDPRGAWLVGKENFYIALAPDTYYFQKYIVYGAMPTQLSETAYAFRLSEVYLLESEATIRSGGNLGQAKTLLKAVMTRAGVTDFSAIDQANTTDEMLLQNYYEIVRNLVGEDGADWMALLRLPLATITQLRPTITSSQQYILPIPASELQANPDIGPQNPGY
ncbi:RagB/SusD family nutrient uptake outer membrane protein [Mucilaginibacter sp. BJC16-A38]|uniref:RagB/SusD family nutrient uptake outer membrane protein n=1 Tax=Mucilaginibacter phenanthrenivorans TaxID=1234842 RepID=UPI0021571595|nr:RagB/SusD family nutrient uptake outer membrane protein [Mucilaginibacter phenanthrenivorans]MCR8557326.1 RagB/SusD family nutrient uptake outer membrane protein [Mucilaginibacter phenanthrenivorans]